MAGTIRTFISIDVPITDEIKNIVDRVRHIRNVKSVSVKQIHITLRFLGCTDERRLPELCSRLQSKFEGFGRFDVSVKGTGVFPDAKRPRVVWMGVESPEPLIKASRMVTEVLDEMGLDYDRKAFSPHITIGRVNGKAELDDVLMIQDIFSQFTCTEIKVMGSELRPTGAVHTVIGTVKL